jgi:cytoskeleton protein RodZ
MPPSVGGLVDSLTALVAAREAKGLSSDDLARKLNLAPRQVLALEAGDWPALPGQAFVRAALRSYGRQIGVDVMPLLTSIGDAAGAPDLRPATSLREPMPRPGLFGFGAGGSGSRLVWIALGIALLVAIAFFFGRVPGLPGSPPAPVAPAGASGALAPGLPDAAPAVAPPAAPTVAPAPADGGPPSAPAAPTAAASASAVPAAPTAAASASPGPAAVTPAAPPPQTVPGVFPPLVPAPSVPAAAPAAAVSVPASAAAPPSGATPGGSAASRPGELRLNFQGESWVEIRRADGQVLHEGVQKRGSALRLPVDAEISVVLGNAQAVQVIHNGGPLDVGPLTRQGVARLKLAP